MKKILLILTILFFTSINYSFAQTDKKTETTIDQLKDKVASRVAELNLVQKKGMIGTVEEVKGNQIKINDFKGNTRLIDTDELTKFSSDENNNFDLSDIKKGSSISAIGLYNKESERLLARFVNEIDVPLFLTGVISDKNSKEFTIKLITEENKTFTIDIENITKTYNFSEGELSDSGFTKINNSENAVVVGFIDPKNAERMTASKIITFPGVPVNPKIDISKIKKEQTITLSPSPSKSEKE